MKNRLRIIFILSLFYAIIMERRLIMTKEDAKKIILGTGSYKDVKCGNTVSVTGDGGNAWNYFGPAYKKLAPKLVTYVPYSEKYKKLLELKKIC